MPPTHDLEQGLQIVHSSHLQSTGEQFTMRPSVAGTKVFCPSTWYLYFQTWSASVGHVSACSVCAIFQHCCFFLRLLMVYAWFKDLQNYSKFTCYLTLQCSIAHRISWWQTCDCRTWRWRCLSSGCTWWISPEIHRRLCRAHVQWLAYCSNLGENHFIYAISMIGTSFFITFIMTCFCCTQSHCHH